jgi:ribonuclease P protein component
MKNTFSKQERLCSTKRIGELYLQGESFHLYPLKFTHLKHQQPADAFINILISAPKHHFKHAHDRNLLKRRIREAYRLNKHIITAACADNQVYLDVSIHYTAKKKETYQMIEQALKNGLDRIEKRYANKLTQV